MEYIKKRCPERAIKTISGHLSNAEKTFTSDGGRVFPQKS